MRSANFFKNFGHWGRKFLLFPAIENSYIENTGAKKPAHSALTDWDLFLKSAGGA
jgi:hypothetical protein